MEDHPQLMSYGIAKAEKDEQLKYVKEADNPYDDFEERKSLEGNISDEEVKRSDEWVRKAEPRE